MGKELRRNPVVSAVLLVTLLAGATAGGSDLPVGPILNGFELQNASIPVESIQPAGPARDGIAVLDQPSALAAANALWHDDEMVIGVILGGAARAYPLAVLHRHELVNDTLGGRALLVSYCPLCGTGLVFDSTVNGTRRRFGASGLAYRSDLLLYDRETESLWSQIESEAVSGPASGSRLRLLRSHQLSWGEWKEQHPGTTVLRPDSGPAHISTKERTR